MIDWLTGTLVSTSLLMLAVLAIREPVRKRFGAAAAYGLWLIPAARMLLPPFTRTVERMVETPAYSAVPGEVASFDVADFPVIAAAQAEPAIPTLVETLGGWPTIALVVWLAGAAAIFTLRMREYLMQRRAILATGVQIARLDKVRIIRSALVRGPVAFGLRDKVIAVPRDFDQRFEPAERRLALDHELAHHRAGDLYANLFAFVLLCLQWFNPLAWVAHAAFRFDQEAACDARVLDKAPASDRLPYGTAIAKAASGRALLFASALDNRSSLKRRLSTMISRPTRRQRLFGTVAVLLSLGVALPMSASYAIEYKDVPVPPLPPKAAKAPAALADLPQPPAAPAASEVFPMDLPVTVAPPAPPAPPQLALGQAVPKPPKLPKVKKGRHYDDGRSIDLVNGRIVVEEDGKVRQWKDLSAAEKAEIREELTEAREALEEVKIERAEIRREIKEAYRDAEIDIAEARRDIAESRAEIDKEIAEIRRNRAKLEAEGENPDLTLASLEIAKASLASVNIEKIVHDATKAALDPSIVESSLEAAEKSIKESKKRIAELEKAARKD